MQLLKLVYLAHGWNLAITNESLINDRVEAWEYGPVIPNLYHSLKTYGAGKVTAPLKGLTPPLGKTLLTMTWDEMKANTKEYTADFSRPEMDLIDRILDVYGGLRAYQLSALTHKEGTPWYTVWHDQDGVSEKDARIDNELIKQHFIELANKRRGPNT